MRRATIVVISILLLTILEIIMRAIIQGGLQPYITYLDWPSFTVDFLVSFVIVIVIALVYYLLYRFWINNRPLLIQGLVTGITVTLFFYLYGTFFNGIAVNFTMPSVLLIVRTFVLGFIFPFLINWIERFFKPVEKQKF